MIPEVWQDLKKKARLEEIELWKTEGPRRQKARDKRAAEAKRPNFIDVRLTDKKNYEEVMSKARKDFAAEEAPPMALVEEMGQTSDMRSRNAARRRKKTITRTSKTISACREQSQGKL